LLEGLGLKGRAWSIEEERLLRQLVEEGKGASKISDIMGKTRISVRAKMYNLGLSVKEATTEFYKPVAAAVAAASSPKPLAETAPVEKPDEIEDVAVELETNRPLPSIEQKMREMDDASKALHRKGLSPTEVARLSKIIEAAKVYNQFFEKYMHYRDIENELVELRRQFESEKSKK
jgi:hypothetical protein